jgi:hypothetical protein
MAVNLSPVFRQRFFTTSGTLASLAGGKLYTYQSGTTTPQATYTDSTGATPNANPVILDSNGMASVWLDSSLSYKFVLKDSNDVTQWTEDGIVGIVSANSVATTSMQDLSVTTAKIANDAVTADKLADSASVDGDRAVTTNHIRDAAITRAKVTSGAVAKSNTSTKTTTYTVTDSDDVLFGNTASAAFTMTLPLAASSTGRFYTFIKTGTDTNTLTIDGDGAETIGGALTRKLTSPGERLVIVSDGSNWQIVRPETISVKAHTSTTGTANATTPVNFDTIDWDTTGSVTVGSSWKFTAPVAGKYMIRGQLAPNGTPATQSLTIWKNGSLYERAGNVIAGYTPAMLNGSIQLSIGDYIEIRSSGTYAYDGTALSSLGASYIMIDLIGP